MYNCQCPTSPASTFHVEMTAAAPSASNSSLASFKILTHGLSAGSWTGGGVWVSRLTNGCLGWSGWGRHFSMSFGIGPSKMCPGSYSASMSSIIASIVAMSFGIPIVIENFSGRQPGKFLFYGPLHSVPKFTLLISVAGSLAQSYLVCHPFATNGFVHDFHSRASCTLQYSPRHLQPQSSVGLKVSH